MPPSVWRRRLPDLRSGRSLPGSGRTAGYALLAALLLWKLGGDELTHRNVDEAGVLVIGKE
ncbi:hypothetical protein Mam01_06030 [Microbispora amethystogenes]|uniref:Uncharacterized protein n=1 Tax=Microbispora amethystogenes TaxID=1427754 RepID=A0ABQ4F6J0_9ACTN|nr:hypothetical protein Mam01_06030 [Microbispora amethystogenes]